MEFKNLKIPQINLIFFAELKFDKSNFLVEKKTIKTLMKAIGGFSLSMAKSKPVCRGRFDTDEAKQVSQTNMCVIFNLILN